jgi:HlyD family secretion protein
MPNRWTIIIVGLAALALLGLYRVLGPGAIRVETEPVQLESFTAYVEEDGRTRVRDRFIVSAPLAGRVPRSPLKVGDTVQSGSVVATIYQNFAPLLEPRVKRELEEKVGTALAAVEEFTALKEQNEVLLERARTDLDRTTKLREKGVASIAQFDRDTFALLAAERDVMAAERRRHAAEHLLAQAEAALKRSSELQADSGFPVTSPIDGRVLRLIQESEAVVALGAPLVELGDTGDLEVIVDVLTTDAALIEKGDKVVLNRWGGANPLIGRVRRIEPSGFTKISALGVEEQRVWVVIDITSPREEWRNLGDGYRIDAQIATDSIESAIVIPVGALFRRGDDWQVFVAEDGRSRLRTVELVSRSGRNAAVRTGLRAGEHVVVYPPNSLKDGSRISLQ